MDQHRKGAAFKDNGTPGDSRTLDAIARRTPKAGGMSVIHTHSGTILTPRKSRTVVSAGPKPLTLKRGTAADKIQVIPGLVNSQYPTLSGTSINHATPPEITVTADVWAWIKVVGTFATPDTYVITIETSATSTVPAGTAITSTGFTSFRGIGRVDYTAGSPATYTIINTHSGGDVGVDSYGSVIHWWKQ